MASVTFLPGRGSRLFAFCALLLLALASAVVNAAPAASEPYAWRNVAIQGGGYVTGLVFHPRERDLLYARTDVGGVFRWDAGRRRWTALNDGITREQAQLHGVLSFALDPADADRLYLACGSYTRPWADSAAFLHSADRGRTWRLVPLPFKLGGNEDGRGTGERLQVSPRNGRTLLLGTSQDGLWRSDDRGATWRRVGGFPGHRVTFVHFGPSSDPSSAPVLYAGAEDRVPAPLYWSRDDGTTWAPVPGQPASLTPHRLVCDAAGVAYVAYANAPGPNGATSGAVWKFDPAASHWTDITPVAPNVAQRDGFGYAGLDLDPRQPGVLVVSTLDRWRLHDEVFRSADGGATWKPLLAGARWQPGDAAYVTALEPHWITTVALDPFDPDRAWFGTGYGVWTSTALRADRPEERAWLFENSGLEETVVDELISPPSGAPLLSALPDLGGFRHDDLDHSPASGMFRPFHGSGSSIAFAALRPELQVRTLMGAVRGAASTDGGATWTEFAASPAAAVREGPGAISLSADGGRILWLPKGSQPFWSRDGGRTWMESKGAFAASRDFNVDRPAADAVNPAVFYLYDRTAGRIYASRDGGETFTALATVPEEGGSLRAEPGSEGRLWLPTQRGLFVSSDGGRSFACCRGTGAAFQVGFGKPAPGASRPTVFFNGCADRVSGLHRSDDAGKTWQRIDSDAHAFGWIRVITGDPRVYGRVYLGTSGRGILRGDPVGP